MLVFGRVLHNWDLATKKMLLKKAHDALPVGGVVVVYERLIDDDRRANVPALLASLNMLLMTSGGFDFTGADCTTWMREGFWAPDGGYARFAWPMIGLAWIAVVSRVLLTRSPATRAGW